MNKLELQTENLLNKVDKPESWEGAATEVKTAMKSFACDVLNMVEGLRENKVTVPVIKNMVAEYGISYNAKSKKFS